MIIPPDPEKDPRLFASSSTPSLIPVDDSEDIADNPSFGYPFGDNASIRSEAYGEILPPYEGRSRVVSGAPEMRERERTPGYIGITIPTHITSDIAASEGSITPTSSTYASGSTARLPTIPSENSSTAKLWEGSSGSLAPLPPRRSAKWKGKSRAFLGLPVKLERDPLMSPPRTQRWWKKWKRWVWALGTVGLIGVGLMIGLLVGLRNTWEQQNRVVPPGPAWHDVEPGDSRWNLAWADGSMNLTWTQPRDMPPQTDGSLIFCNTFTPFNSSDPSTNFTSLSTPYPSNKLWVSTYFISLQQLNTSSSPYTIIPDTSLNTTIGANATGNASNPLTRPMIKASSRPLGLLNQLPIFARGIASSGTVEIIGRDAEQEVIDGGAEGTVRVDVVVQYGGVQSVPGIMRVCELSRPDGGVGVGVYTPIVTDGKISNPYTLDPTQLPSFHIIIRFPPSLYAASPSRPLYIANMLMRLDKMGVRVGNLSGIADFGTWNVTSDRGGAVVKYVAGKDVWVQTAENAVRGTFNVSQSLYINSTDSSILADIILHDPSSTINTTLSRSTVASRALANSSYPAVPADLPADMINTTASVLTHNFTHTVNTTLYTSDGLIRIKYIAHPPMTALSSWTSLSSGEMDVSVHPNYVGPFALKNAWGMCRLPRPAPNPALDPVGEYRRRAVVLGSIAIQEGSLFAREGLNETLLPMSGTTITGAAYWQEGVNGTMTPEAVQQGEEGMRGSQMMLLGGWGDMTLRFDGT